MLAHVSLFEIFLGFSPRIIPTLTFPSRPLVDMYGHDPTVFRQKFHGERTFKYLTFIIRYSQLPFPNLV